MSMKQEPIIFNFKPGGSRADAPALAKLPQVTLLINPETITIPWKKIITRVRTKSRIVSLYWGQEPLTLTYKGQTGNLYPNIELQKRINETVGNDIKKGIENLNKEIANVDKQIEEKENHWAASQDSPFQLEITASELDSLQHDRLVLLDSIRQLTEEVRVDLTDGMSHTEIIKLSPKYQKFDALRKLYEKSQTIPELMYVRYRDWLFEGYFENFNFTDDVKSSWNWTYNLTFTILNWDELGFSSFSGVDETLFVPDPTVTVQEQLDIDFQAKLKLQNLSTGFVID